MRPASGGSARVARALLALLAALAFACGALAVALYREHARAECFRDAAEVGVDPEKCAP